MKSQIEFALANPVFDPTRQITTGHFWRTSDLHIGAGLTVNIGLE